MSVISVHTRATRINGKIQTSDHSTQIQSKNFLSQLKGSKKTASSPTLVCHTPDGCKKTSKAAGNSELYDHAIAYLNVNPKAVLTIEDSRSGASSAAYTKLMKSIGFNPTKDPAITKMLYESGSQLVVYSHKEYQAVMKREATSSFKSIKSRFSPGVEKRKIFNDSEGIQKSGRDYFSDPAARLTNRPAKAFTPDVDGVFFDSEPKVLKAVVQSLHDSGVEFDAAQQKTIEHDIIGTSLDIMKNKILPKILGDKVPDDFKENASKLILNEYKSIEIIPGAIDTIKDSIKLFGAKNVTPVSNAMPEETTVKFKAHGIKTNVKHLAPFNLQIAD